MNAIEVCKQVAEQIAVDVPGVLVAATDAKAVIMRNLLEEECTDLWRRGEWSGIRGETNVTSTGAVSYTMPADFGRMLKGGAVRETTGSPPLRPVSNAQYHGALLSAGDAKYYRLNGKIINFYPNPTGPVFNVQYVKNTWNGDATKPNILLADDYELPFPAEALIRGVIWRYRRDLGEEYSDHLAEYDAALAQYDEYDKDVSY